MDRLKSSSVRNTLWALSNSFARSTVGSELPSDEVLRQRPEDAGDSVVKEAQLCESGLPSNIFALGLACGSVDLTTSMWRRRHERSPVASLPLFS